MCRKRKKEEKNVLDFGSKTGQKKKEKKDKEEKGFRIQNWAGGGGRGLWGVHCQMGNHHALKVFFFF